jgi:hypothetical protein
MHRQVLSLHEQGQGLSDEPIRRLNTCILDILKDSQVAYVVDRGW